MCGIAGWLGHVDDGNAVAGRMRALLHHRGPDASGVRSFDGATLIHTRLSIIDLSEAGAQPMPGEDGTVWTVLNGEIYNHAELRATLESKGHRFRGRSDTEVIPALYQEYGDGFASHLRGMFAIGLYDSRERRLLVVRDRFGIKPLFYTVTDERLAFASEVRALREVPGLDERPNLQAIFDYLALGYIAAPETVFRGMQALEPSTLLEVWSEGGRIVHRARRYHRWVVAPRHGWQLGTAVAEAESLLNRSVERQMQSDVPLGALLSGGIDSSLVSTAAQRATGQLQTFNVQFSGDYDETWAANAVARHVGSSHRTLRMDAGEAGWQEVTGLLAHAGQPFADPSLFAVSAVSRLMREHVTVVLSGDGGDEGFGGYDISWQIARFASLQRVPPAIWSAASAVATPLANMGVMRGWLPERLSELPTADDAGILRNMICVLREREQVEAFEGGDVQPTRRLFEPAWQNVFDRGAGRLERLSGLMTEVHLRLALANGYLFKVDTASMRESIEVRVPLLDEDLVGFALTLPHDLKVERRMGKRVLRTIADRWLPPEVARRPKAGFAMPVDTWVDAGFKTRLHETLLGSGSKLQGLLRRRVYERWLTAFRDGTPLPEMSRGGLSRRAILLLSLHLSLCETAR
jgi:asparagine synthase (glutamine-hydrolysing)